MTKRSPSYYLAQARRCARKWRKRLGITGTATVEDARRLAERLGRLALLEVNHDQAASVWVCTRLRRRPRWYVAVCLRCPDPDAERDGICWGIGSALFRAPACQQFQADHSSPLARAFAGAFING